METFLNKVKNNRSGLNALKNIAVKLKDYEWDEDVEGKMFNLIGLKGGMVVKNQKWINIEHHGYINFYSSVNDIWYEFNAKFTDGNLVNIERVGKF